MVRRFTGTWTTVRKIPPSVSASPMPGCLWPALETSVAPMVCQSMNGVFVSTAANRLAQPLKGAELPWPRSCDQLAGDYVDWLQRYAWMQLSVKCAKTC